MKTKLIVEFYGQWVKAAVVHYQGIFVYVKDVIIEPIDPSFDNISGVVKKIIAQAGRNKKPEVVVCLNRNKITLRRIELLSKDTREIEQMLALHVIRQVPYVKEEIIWGYQNLGFDGINSSAILLAIVHRDLLRKIFNAFTPLNMAPERMMVSSQGVFHYIRNSLKDRQAMPDICLILDIDFNTSELILVNKQQIHSSMIISYGAEQLKPETEIGKFIAEIEQALLVFRNELVQLNPERIFLSGAGGDAVNLNSALEKKLNLKIEPVNSKDYKKFVRADKGMSFSAVFGFAYQQRKEDICFILPEAQIQREIKSKVQQFLILGGITIYIFILLGLAGFSKLNQRQSYRGKLKKEVSRIKEKSGKLSDMFQKIALVRQYKGKNPPVLNYIVELNRLCPENIVITNFIWDKHSGLVIRGYARQMSEIFSFTNTLENTNLFKGLQARSTRRRKIKDDEVVDFEIGAK